MQQTLSGLVLSLLQKSPLSETGFCLRCEAFPGCYSHIYLLPSEQPARLQPGPSRNPVPGARELLGGPGTFLSGSPTQARPRTRLLAGTEWSRAPAREGCARHSQSWARSPARGGAPPGGATQAPPRAHPAPRRRPPGERGPNL
ncbi:unnamed protein product [Rangifer tarandus platyrhynchus]|uniref:Uncharacterized protein n=1 Tax=Rangifer tarandus platyrhynchus TaxID=3082113 RepID=A0ACB1MJN9_RANTA